MIDEYNANYKVGVIHFDVHEYNYMDDDLIKKMVDRYHNVYDIEINHTTDSVNSNIHNLI